jgi:hypothetical protein
MLTFRYVPKPNPRVFRVTKNNHNILQGVASKDIQFDDQSKHLYECWVSVNCERYWSSPEGPFVTSDIIVLDDTQGNFHILLLLVCICIALTISGRVGSIYQTSQF